MSDNSKQAKQTKNTKSQKNSKQKTTRSQKNQKLITTSYISLPGNKKLKMNFVRWVMLITLLIILIVFLLTSPNRMIKRSIKGMESQEEIIAYCTKKNLNCTYSILSDYDLEGYQVSRVSFLADDFFDKVEDSSSASETNEEQSQSSEKAETVKKEKKQKNVYITIQKGNEVNIPGMEEKSEKK